MSLWRDRLRRAVTETAASTSIDADDPRLRGRTYAVPFDAVWRASCSLADGGLRRWSLVRSNDEEGRIRASSRTLLFGNVSDVHIRIGLDENGQTRVDMHSASRDRRFDLGVNARRIHRFCRALDQALGARDLPRVAPSSWSGSPTP